MIVLASFGLSLPLMLRAIVDFLRFSVTSIETYINENDEVYNIFVFLFLDCIPLCFQLSTLIFGYIRQRDNKKYTLEVDGALIGDNTRAYTRESETDAFTNNSSMGQSYFDPPLL